MAQTLIASPQTFSPSYNPLKFIVDSTNKNNSGFKYVFQVFEGGTTNKIGEYKVIPRINDGYGEQDLSKLIQSQVLWTLDTTSTASIEALKSKYDYSVKIGEEYVAEYIYTANLTNNSGNVRISTTNTFVAGDQVVITQADGGVANPLLEGLHTVISATSSTVTVNVAWSSITSNTIDGVVRYADNRKIITLNIINLANYRAFNGAVRHMDWMLYDENDYVMNGITKQFVTKDRKTSCRERV